MERERDKYSKDAVDAMTDLQKQMDEIKKKEGDLFKLKKKIVETESKLRQQQVQILLLVLLFSYFFCIFVD